LKSLLLQVVEVVVMRDQEQQVEVVQVE